MARSTFAPLFDIPQPTGAQSGNLGAYLQKKVLGITTCWAPDRPVYVDARDFPVDTVIDHRFPAEMVSEAVHSHGFMVVPVTGTDIERGSDYVRKIGRLASELGNGVCLRIEREEVIDPDNLSASISRTLNSLHIPYSQIDVLFDMDFVGRDSPMSLHAILLDALQAIPSLPTFRNVVVAGGSVPEQLGKRDTGVVRREARVEIQAWTQLTATGNFGNPIAFGDFGVINPRYVKPGRPVNVPARVRYTTIRDHVLLRTARSGHADLCRELVGMHDYSGPAFSAGDQRMQLAAQGLASPGNPGMWIAGDLNHHLEVVSAQVLEAIRRSGSAAQYSLPEPRHYPWLQPLLIEE